MNNFELLSPYCTVQWSFTILVVRINVCKEISKKSLPLYNIIEKYIKSVAFKSNGITLLLAV